jgi:hypothetical protein
MKIYYSIQNGGDGSAYPVFLESQELARWDQEHMDEGWGEDCDGYITVETDGVVSCPDMRTVIGYYLSNCEDEYWSDQDKQSFEETFFPDGVPTFEVKIQEDDARHYYIFVAFRRHYKALAWDAKAKKAQTSEAGRLELETRLNK